MTPLILIVDDDPLVCSLLVRFLAIEGYATVVASSGAQAMVSIERDPPDLVLLDVDLPEMNGFEICRRIKAHDRTALIPVTMITGRDDADSRTQGIEAGADDFLTKPFDDLTLRARIRTQLRLKRITDQLERTESVIFTMARCVERKDEYTEEHLRRVAGFAERTAVALGLDAAEVVHVRYAGILHDVGKVAIPDTILGKNGPLTEDERKILERHPDIGAEIIAPMRFAPSVAPAIRGHHERWDGTGYPHRLAGEEIPIGARIIAVVDAWDAMITDRPYRRGLDPTEAERRLCLGAGSQWDEEMVRVFLDLFQSGELRPMDLHALEAA